MSDSGGKRVLFFQHSNHNGGAPRSLRQIVAQYELEYGPQNVLFIRHGPVLKTYEGLLSTIRCGRFILPFHGSEVSGMSPALAVRNIIGIVIAPFAYYKHLRGYDVVYLNSSSLCIYGLLLKTFSKKTRVIMHVREPLLRNFWGALIRWISARGSDHIIAISKNELSNMDIPHIPSDVVYNYVHSSEYRVASRRSLHINDPNLDEKKAIVGYFARLDTKNGIIDFLKVAQAFEGDTSVAFCIYGRTGHESDEVAAALKAAGVNVHVYPMVQDVPTNLTDISLLLVPFKVPHFSRSVIEAAMLKIPSIAYDIESVNETIEHGISGYLVRQGDIEGMISRLRELLNDEGKLATFRDAAYNIAIKSFSERNYDRIRDVINHTYR